jgi:hypothetical protein
VNPVNDPPGLAEIADVTLLEGQTFRVSAVGSDVDQGETLRYALHLAPSGASIDPDSGAIVWQGLDGDANATRDFRVGVSDASGESATRSFKVIVLNVAPTLTAEAVEASYIGQDFALKLTSSDPGDDTISNGASTGATARSSTTAATPARSATSTAASSAKCRSALPPATRTAATCSPLPVVVLPQPLQVESLSSDSNGFAVRFNDAFNASVINLYDSSLVGRGAADVVLIGSSTGLVKGSLVFDADYRGLRYQVSGNGLAADGYSVTLKSGAQAFHSIWSALDGNADGLAGDDYRSSFSVAAAPSRSSRCPTSCADRGRASMSRRRAANCR